MLTLHQALANFTVDQLKQFSQLLPDAASVGRKDELVRAVMHQYLARERAELHRPVNDFLGAN